MKGYKYILPVDLMQRKAANFVYDLSQLKYDVKIIKDNTMVNAKSMIGILSLCLKKGDEIEFVFGNGAGAEDDLDRFNEVVGFIGRVGK